MTANLLDGTSVGNAIKQEVAEEVASYATRGLRPGLAAVLVGSDPASQRYVASKVRTCEQLGLYSEKIELPESTTTEELLALVTELNGRDEIDGILVQMPLPRQVDATLVLRAVDPAKDVDGFHPVSIGRLALNRGRGLWYWGAAASSACRWLSCSCTKTPPSPSVIRARKTCRG